MPIGAKYNDGFVNPEPGFCLFQIKSVKFDKNDAGECICLTQYEIVECAEVPDNVGKKTGEYFGLHDINGKFFGIENFLGLLHKATGKTKEVEVDYFTDVKVQSQIEKSLPDCLFAGDVVITKDKVDPNKEYANVKGYKSKDEYKATARTTANSTGAKAPAPNAAGDSSSGDSSSGRDSW